MKKYTIILSILSIFTTSICFADREDYSGQDIYTKNFTGLSMRRSVWEKCKGAYSSDGGGSKAATFIATNLTGANFKDSILSASSPGFRCVDGASVDFSYANLTNAIFDGATLTSCVTEFTSYTAMSTRCNFKGANLTGASFKNSILHYQFLSWNRTSVDFSEVNLMRANFTGTDITGVNFEKSDLRGAIFASVSGSAIYKNTIGTDGVITNISMTSADDSMTIRKYVPATSDGAMINAKIADDASISGGAVLTLEQGAVLEIASGKTLSVLDNSEIIFNVDAAASDATKILLGENSKLVFSSDSKIIVNLDGVISPDDSYALSVIEVAADACISVADAISKDNLVLNVNGEAYDSDKWGFNFDPTTGALTINVNVPEPTTVAAIFGALALAFAVYRRRK